jgi:hypothetical protein
MTAMDTTKLAIDAITPSKFRLSMADYPENDLADTRRPTLVMDKARSSVAKGGASKRHDREMLSPAAIPDDQIDGGARFPLERARVVRRTAVVATDVVTVLGESAPRLVERLLFRFP